MSDNYIRITKEQAVRVDRRRMKSLNWKFPTVRDGTSVVYAEFKGPHGKVKTKKDRERIYYILEGKGQFEIEKELLDVAEGDVIAIQPNTTYNYWPTEGSMIKILLVMDQWNS